MIAVVTGSTGFIGSHVVDALLEKGATVRALVRPQSRVTRRIAGVDYREVDVLDARAVERSPVWEGATHLFHLAGVTAARSLSEFRLGNVRPLENVLRALASRGAAGTRVVVVSSQAAGGPAAEANAVAAREVAAGDDSEAPVEWYGQSKLEAERVAFSYLPQPAVTILRPPAVYGPRDTAFLALFRQAASPVALFATPPSHRIELAYVSDVVSAILAAAVNDSAIGRRYTVTGFESVNWRDIYSEVAYLSGRPLRAISVPGPVMRAAGIAGDLFGMVTQRTPLINSRKLILGSQPLWLASGARIRNELGWTPQVSLRQGVRKTYLWYIAQGLLRAPRTDAPLHSIERDSKS